MRSGRAIYFASIFLDFERFSVGGNNAKKKLNSEPDLTGTCFRVPRFYWIIASQCQIYYGEKYQIYSRLFLDVALLYILAIR